MQGFARANNPVFRRQHHSNFIYASSRVAEAVVLVTASDPSNFTASKVM